MIFLPVVMKSRYGRWPDHFATLRSLGGLLRVFDIAAPYLVRDSRNHEEDHHGLVGISAFCLDTARRGDCARPETGPFALRPSVEAYEATHDAPGAEGTDQTPANAVALPMNIFGSMAATRSFSIIPETAALSPGQAAKFVTHRRRFLFKRPENGHLPHRTASSHREAGVQPLLLLGCPRQRPRGHPLSTYR